MSDQITDSLVPFSLEDFFYEYEHRPDLINVASSDAQPWTASELLDKGVSFTNATLGYPDVKQTLIPALTQFCRPSIGTDLLPTSGAAEAIALVIHELSTKRSNSAPLAIPWPAYGAFYGLAALLRLPVEKYYYDPSRGWMPDIDELRSLSKRCSGMVVINPHNPTGKIISKDVLMELATELSSRGGVLIVDEVFRVSGESESAMMLDPEVVVIGSLSKTYGLPGLRLGWVAARDQRLARLRTVQHYLTLTVSAMAVAFGVAILSKVEQFSRASLIDDNRRLLKDWSEQHSDKLSVSLPLGGTTVCLMIHNTVDEMWLFERFLQAGVLLAPGTLCFDYPHSLPWFRLGYAIASNILVDALDRIGAVIKAL